MDDETTTRKQRNSHVNGDERLREERRISDMP
jgi:hypothetical protein